MVSINSGHWFQIENGEIIGESWGVPGLPKNSSVQQAKASGWFPGIESGADLTKDPLGYETTLTSKTIVADIVQMVYTTAPKELATVQTTATAKVDEQMEALLSPTDWYVIRKADAGTAIPDAVNTARTTVRTKGATAKAAITAATDVDAIIALFPLSLS